MKKTSSSVLGDVFEIKTPNGLAYLQFTLKDSEFGHLIRVLPGFFSKRPSQVNEVVEKPELFFVFFPVDAAVKKGILARVTNEKIPVWAQKQPLMRRSGLRNREGKALTWFIWDGEKEIRVDELNKGQKKLSLAEIWNDTLLVERLCEGWLPESEP
jgi:hypothetical protein